MRLFASVHASFDPWQPSSRITLMATMPSSSMSRDAYPEADSEFETCLKGRGEATAVFLDDNPTYHTLPPLYHYIGRAQEGLKSPAAAESYKTFLAMKANADGDLLAADAKKRITAH